MRAAYTFRRRHRTAVLEDSLLLVAHSALRDVSAVKPVTWDDIGPRQTDDGFGERGVSLDGLSPVWELFDAAEEWLRMRG